jgi:uncharacterized protein (DUF302 family)
MKPLILAAAVVVAASSAFAEIVRVPVAAGTDVPATVDRLVAAVEGAGATVFARIDHGAGAERVGTPTGASQLVIFGNPALGTPAILDDPLAGLFLPLKALVFEDAEGKVWLTYQPPAETFAGTAVPPDAAYLGKMTGALEKFTAAASGG